jgi:hypothetical protein
LTKTDALARLDPLNLQKKYIVMTSAETTMDIKDALKKT